MPVTPEEPKWLYQNWDDEFVITAGSTGVIGQFYAMTPTAGRPTMQLCGQYEEGYPCVGLGSVGGAGAAGTRCEFRIHGIAPINTAIAMQGGIEICSDANGLGAIHPGAGNTAWTNGRSLAQSQGATHRISMLIERNYIA